jgi:hypothetical protein
MAVENPLAKELVHKELSPSLYKSFDDVLSWIRLKEMAKVISVAEGNINRSVPEAA